MQRLKPQQRPLSKREVEVIELLARGLRYQEIADELGISFHTAKFHLRKRVPCDRRDTRHRCCRDLRHEEAERHRMKSNPIKLSIVIVTLPDRAHTLTRLLAQLHTQPRFNECEVVIVLDDRRHPIGFKRNQGVAACCGQYIVHIDDDDEVSPNYIDRILTAIDLNAGSPPDAIIVRGRCTSPGLHPVEFDYSLDVDIDEARWVSATGEALPCLWRTPGHLCAIRAWICQSVQFTTPDRGEDLQWAARARPLLKTVARASWEPLYFYRLAPEKACGIPQMVHQNASPSPVERTIELVAHEPIFAPQYTEKSGPGSTDSYSYRYARFLEDFIAEHNITSLFDLGCGDMQIMRRVINNAPSIPLDRAIFVDVIAERIARNRADRPDLQFAHHDIRTFPLDADLIVCKDVLQHWSNAEVLAFVDRLRANRHRFRFALITNCCYGPTINTEIETGGWRALDLTREPFNAGTVVFKWGDEIGGFKETVLIKGLR